MSLTQTPIPVEWRKPVEDWTKTLRAAQLSPNTIRTRLERLRHFARWCDTIPPHQVTAGMLVEYSGAHDWSLETRRSAHATLKSFYRFQHATGTVETDISIGLPRVRMSQPRPRPASDTAIKYGLENAGAREYFILSLAAYVGLRREEIVKIHKADVFQDILGYSLLVHGKGGKDRLVPLPELLGRQVKKACEDNGGYLLPGNISGHMSARYAGKLATRVLPAGVTLHMLRHRFGTVAYAKSRDIAAVQDILGHTSPATTRRYIAVENTRLREVIQLAG